jgi:hypothetical protein
MGIPVRERGEDVNPDQTQSVRLLEVDARRRLNLTKVGHHDRYTVVVHEDGTIVLTPAIVLSPAELHFLQDDEIRDLVSQARSAADGPPIRKDRRR